MDPQHSGAVEAAAGACVEIGGRRLISFAGCDSLGLARHPDVVAAAALALRDCGVGAAASRATTGTWAHHVDLEHALATWLREEDAVLLPSGWLSVQALAGALAPCCDAVIVDVGAHPAVHDASRLTGLPVRTYRHLDGDHARAVAGTDRALIVTDSVDLVHGRLAPLADLAAAAAATGGALLVDDAHGVGVLGPAGRGAVAAAGAEGAHVLVAGSLSKALGAAGGFFAASRATCDAIRSHAHVYAGATPLPPAVAAAACAAVHLAASGDALRERLAGHARRLREGFAALGLTPPEVDVPWLAVHGLPAHRLQALADGLLEAGFLAPRTAYFGAPEGGVVRLVPSAAHEEQHVTALLDALAPLL